MKRTIVALICVVVGQVQAQDNGLKWSLSTGPTLALPRTGPSVCANAYCNAFNISSGARFISGAEHGKYNATLGVSKRWTGTSLTFRGDVHYSRSESPFHANRPLVFSDSTFPRYWVQNAPRDEMFAATLGLEWHAFPDRPVSPYVTTSFGMALNRLSWNSDTSSKRLDAQHDAIGPVSAFGAGVRVKLKSHEVFLEWRSFTSLIDLPGSKIVPFSIGLRF